MSDSVELRVQQRVCSTVILTTDLLADSHITVRHTAAKILSGLLHSGLRSKVSKVRVKGKRLRKGASHTGSEQISEQGQGVINSA